MLNGLDLFTGIGGMSFGLRGYIRPVAYCECEVYCQKVLLSRMATRELPNCPIWDDIRTLSGDEFRERIDIIYGGFPCQDISIAGNGKGLGGERSGLFFEMLRLAKEIEPKFIFIENVPAITTRGGLQIVKEIASLGYDCRWCVISAASIGAMHERKRWFLLAHSASKKSDSQRFGNEEEYTMSSHCGINELCHSNSQPSEQAYPKTIADETRQTAWGRPAGQCWPFASRDDWQKTVSEMGKCSDGIPNHVDRLRALGNAVVPQQVRRAFEMLMGII